MKAKKRLVPTKTYPTQVYSFDVPAQYVVDIYNALTFASLHSDAFILTTGVDPKSIYAVEDMRMYLNRFIEDLDVKSSKNQSEYN